jgi:predicted phosphodiesterase
MKIAVLADIHANFEALQTVAAHIEAWRPARVVVAGDIVNRGPRSPECLNFVLEKAQTDDWLIVRGNHEDYVISVTREKHTHSDIDRVFLQAIYWTEQQLREQVDTLAAFPDQQSLYLFDRDEVRITHGSMCGIRDGIYPGTEDEELREKIAPPPAVLCVGHTHRPLVRQIDETLVVNVGAVGLPFDGDTRAAYGQLEWRNGNWQARIIRLTYDLAQAERDFEETGFLEHGGPLVPLVLDELRKARSHLYSWTRQYHPLIMNGEISMAESVRQYMATW